MNRFRTWDKKPLLEPIVVSLNDFIQLRVVNQKEVTATFKVGENKVVFQLGKVMRRSDTYLDKVTSVGTGSERGKFTLDINKCRDALAKTQVLRDSFKASKVDPNAPRAGALDPRVIEMANNPKKVTTKAIRDQIQVIMDVLNLPWCDFCIWTPDLIHIHRVPFDRNYCPKELKPVSTGTHKLLQ